MCVCSSDPTAHKGERAAGETVLPLFPPPEVSGQGCLKHGSLVAAAGSGRR